MNMNCRIHDFTKHHNRVYRCKQCGLLELADYYLSDIRIKHYASFIEGECYAWHPELMQVSQMEKFAISFGDRPIVSVTFNGTSLKIQYLINGSRDGWMSFPEGYFEEKEKNLTPQQIKDLWACLESIHFEEWLTPEYVFENAGCDGFCVNESFSCSFQNGIKFICEDPCNRDFDNLVLLIQMLIR